jgi:hypothetical protein
VERVSDTGRCTCRPAQGGALSASPPRAQLRCCGSPGAKRTRGAAPGGPRRSGGGGLKLPPAPLGLQAHVRGGCSLSICKSCAKCETSDANLKKCERKRRLQGRWDEIEGEPGRALHSIDVARFTGETGVRCALRTAAVSPGTDTSSKAMNTACSALRGVSVVPQGPLRRVTGDVHLRRNAGLLRKGVLGSRRSTDEERRPFKQRPHASQQISPARHAKKRHSRR